MHTYDMTTVRTNDSLRSHIAIKVCVNPELILLGDCARVCAKVEIWASIDGETDHMAMINWGLLGDIYEGYLQAQNQFLLHWDLLGIDDSPSERPIPWSVYENQPEVSRMDRNCESRGMPQLVPSCTSFVPAKCQIKASK